MKVEVILVKRMIKRSIPLYLLLLIVSLVRSQEAFVTSLIASVTVTFVFLLNAYMQSYAASISINLFYVSALFGFFLRIALTILILLAFKVAYPMDLVILPISVIILFVGMLAIESITLLKKDKDLDWIDTE
jgi:hypothetical protein|tara:strand:- start:34 stop:429 length:396 start_codon:yes stop_codon:yes gene_type:complete